MVESEFSCGAPTTLLRLLPSSLKRDLCSGSASGSGFTMLFHATTLSNSVSMRVASHGVIGAIVGYSRDQDTHSCQAATQLKKPTSICAQREACHQQSLCFGQQQQAVVMYKSCQTAHSMVVTCEIAQAHLTLVSFTRPPVESHALCAVHALWRASKSASGFVFIMSRAVSVTRLVLNL